MRNFILLRQYAIATVICTYLLFNQLSSIQAQTPAFPGATGFGRFAKGARAIAHPQVYVVTNLNDNGPGSFREAVSVPGRVVVFAVGGIIHLLSDIVVAPYTTIAGQTAPGDGIVLFGKRVTFTGASHTICRYLRIRLGATGNSGKDASGLANGANMIFDHMSFSWGMDEVFSINWDSKGTAPDSITIQNSIIAQGLHRENHSAGGLIQTPDGGKVSLIRNLYISNKTRNPKVKGVNEFVNNVVYDWGNGNRLGDNMNYGWSGDAYIMGGSSGVSEVNIINNYFMGGPLTPPDKTTPFSRGTGTFFLYGAGNYFDNNKNGVSDGVLVPYDSTDYPGIAADGFRTQAFPYPQAAPAFTAEQAYSWICDSAGASYPRRDQVDSLLAAEVRSRGTQGYYVYRESDLPFTNGGAGNVFNAPAPLDTDGDGLPDTWEDAQGLNKNNAQDAVAYSITFPEYLNIEVYINSLMNGPAPAFIPPPSHVTLTASTIELPAPYSKVTIQWTDNAGSEDHFILERSTDGVTYTDIAHAAANSTSWNDTIGLTPNTTYYYRLQAVNATGLSSYSAPASIKTPPLPSAPAQASVPVPANGFRYAELSSGSLVLKWTGSTNTGSYSVYFGTDTAQLVKKADIPYTANASYTISGLSDFITYYWRIDAENNKGVTQGEWWQFRTTKVFPAGLTGHWSFDETEGRQVTDSSIYQDHGILGLDDDNQRIRVAGKINNALDFATANPNMYVVNVPHQDQLYLDKSSFSLSFWMKADASLLPADNTTSAYLLCKGSITRNAATGATGKRFDIEFKSKQIRFAIDDDNDSNGGGKDELQADGTPFFTGNWVHVTTIRDTAAKKLRLYMNGSLVKETTITKANAGIGEASDLIIGNIGALEFLSTVNKPAPYKGMLDELKVLNYALTASQVLELFHTSPLPLPPYAPSLISGAMLEGYGDSVRVSWKGGLKTSHYRLYAGTDSSNLPYITDISLDTPAYTFTHLTEKNNYYWRVDAVGPAGTTTGALWWFRTVSPKGMTGHWQFNETSGTTVADNSNYHQPGTISGMPEALFANGKFGNALPFQNPTATGAVRIPHTEHLLFDANSFTISLWVKLTNGSSNYNSSVAKDCYLIHKGQFTDPGGKWYGIQLKDSTLTFAIDDASVKSNLDISVKRATAFNIFNNEWTNIIAIKDTAARQIKLFINGMQAGAKTYTATGTTGKALPLVIGNSAENKPFHDIMDDVRLYNYALPPAEIANILSGTPLIAKATDPQPANGDTVGYGNIALQWKGRGQTYNVYAGTSPDSLVLQSAGVTSAHFTLTGITTLGTWFWRTDAVRDGETATGDIWSFVVADTVPPTVITKNISITLSGGSATITVADIDNGSWDAYGIKSMTIDKSRFTCAQMGAHEVLLTVTDSNNNMAMEKATVAVAGAIPAPVIAVSRTDNTYTGAGAHTLFLGYGAQQLTLSAMDQSSPGPTQYSWSPATGLSNPAAATTLFTPVQAGEYTFTVTATNEYGCTDTTSVTITVIDVRCGRKQQKVTLCHYGREICINPWEVRFHLRHGDRLGDCRCRIAGAGTAGETTSANRTLMVYPTPASGHCTVAFRLHEPGSYRIEVYNTQGRLVHTIGKGEATAEQLFTYTINTSRLAEGMYFIKLITPGAVQVAPMIIQR